MYYAKVAVDKVSKNVERSREAVARGKEVVAKNKETVAKNKESERHTPEIPGPVGGHHSSSQLRAFILNGGAKYSVSTASAVSTSYFHHPQLL